MWPRVVFQAPVVLDDEETRSPRPMTWGTSRHGRDRLRHVKKTKKKQTPRKMTARRGRSMDGGLDKSYTGLISVARDTG